MQLRETEGRMDSIPVEYLALSSITLAQAVSAVSASEVNVLEEPIREIWKKDAKPVSSYHGYWLVFRPHETKFLLLELPLPAAVGVK